jgi:diguanylate cyclase (GGDEF)-like protein
MNDAGNNLPLWLAFLALSRQATRDGLTGLYNRRYFEEALPDHVAVANRYQRDLSLVIFDLDRFKHINDTEGHQAGDEVLRQFADILKSTARRADIVCRYGGDEFAVILPETGRTDAAVFVERVFRALDALNENRTVTAGIAALPCENLVREADAELLARKRESRQ